MPQTFFNDAKMSLAQQVAAQYREIYLNGKWVIGTNLKEQLQDVTWEQATTKIGNLNTIAALTFHLHYYVAGVLRVLQGGTLDIRDKYSFDMPPIESQADWEKRTGQLWEDAETFASIVEQLSDEQLNAPFVDEKYGTYLRNVHVLIEHGYYHFGQIVLLKKLLNQ